MKVGRIQPLVESAPFFTTTDGRTATLYTLQSGSFSASICDWGATLVSMQIPSAGGDAVDVLLGHENPYEYEQNRGHFGATVGRFANRIVQGTFSLDGIAYALDINEGEHHLHGGFNGFSARLWTAVAGTDEERAFIQLETRSPDGESGYPGNVAVSARFTLSPTGDLRVVYKGTSDKATPLSITSHPYFNLQGRGNVLGHVLRLRSDTVLPVGAGRIPSGPPVFVSGTVLDFSVDSIVGDVVARTGGVDACYPVLEPGDLSTPAAVLRDPGSGRSLELYTDMPAIQLYTGNSLGGRHGKGGTVYENWSGLCLEPEYFPDSPNHPDYPDCVLRPGNTYRHELRFVFRP